MLIRDHGSGAQRCIEMVIGEEGGREARDGTLGLDQHHGSRPGSEPGWILKVQHDHGIDGRSGGVIRMPRELLPISPQATLGLAGDRHYPNAVCESRFPVGRHLRRDGCHSASIFRLARRPGSRWFTLGATRRRPRITPPLRLPVDSIRGGPVPVSAKISRPKLTCRRVGKGFEAAAIEGLSCTAKRRQGSDTSSTGVGRCPGGHRAPPHGCWPPRGRGAVSRCIWAVCACGRFNWAAACCVGQRRTRDWRLETGDWGTGGLGDGRAVVAVGLERRGGRAEMKGDRRGYFQNCSRRMGSLVEGL
ncbi:hypothetical protein BS50DRAFT_641897 [Corynespora cassiicola Philippines]|uniref:Uncharacterized protein n=1 Tax=Corynespora cassiicola Philippines TaxID=1448308 RepID=A0A2T2P8C7_CORCC|nr:hypothetical protein BS50DRAFT_641897 [Corynespora cassiicola Philippines]